MLLMQTSPAYIIVESFCDSLAIYGVSSIAVPLMRHSGAQLTGIHR